MEKVFTGRSESPAISPTTMLESIPPGEERAERHVADHPQAHRLRQLLPQRLAGLVDAEPELGPVVERQ